MKTTEIEKFTVDLQKPTNILKVLLSQWPKKSLRRKNKILLHIFWNVSKQVFRVKNHFFEHWTKLNIIFGTSNWLKPVHLLVIKLEHAIFGFLTNGHQHRTDQNPLLDLLNYSSSRLENVLWNIKLTWTCSSFDNQTPRPNFWLRMNKHKTHHYRFHNKIDFRKVGFFSRIS